jgi:hypothetical protein
MPTTFNIPLNVVDLHVTGTTALVQNDMTVLGTLYGGNLDITGIPINSLTIPGGVTAHDLHAGHTVTVAGAVDIQGPVTLTTEQTLNVNGITGGTFIVTDYLSTVDLFSIGGATFYDVSTPVTLTGSIDYTGITYIGQTFDLNNVSGVTVGTTLQVGGVYTGSTITSYIGHTVYIGSTTDNTTLIATSAFFTDITNLAKIVAGETGLYIQSLSEADDSANWKFILYNMQTSELGYTATVEY